MFMNFIHIEKFVSIKVLFKPILLVCKQRANLTTLICSRCFSLETSKKTRMIVEHLAQGSVEPPTHPGMLTLYGMRFCPYDQRVHLVLIAKNIPHENIWINLVSKPDWFLKKIPSGKVPGLIVDGGHILYESLIIADYLDEKYPQQPLHSKDPLKKAKDKIVIDAFNKVISAFLRLAKAPSHELVDALLNELLVFDNELANRNTKYFAGDKPGMVDYMIWPWFERFQAGKVVFDASFDLSKLKHLVSWIGAMKEDRVVKEYLLSPGTHAEFIKNYVAGSPKYDIPIK